MTIQFLGSIDKRKILKLFQIGTGVPVPRRRRVMNTKGQTGKQVWYKRKDVAQLMMAVMMPFAMLIISIVCVNIEN